MKIINIKGLLLLSLFTLLGCDDEEFLIEEPKTFYTIDNIFSSGVQVEQSLISLYSRNRIFRLDERLNRGQGTDVMVIPAFRYANHFSDYSTINAEHARVRAMYDTHYQLIAMANTTLAAADLEGITFESEATRSHVLAQARFFRAYAHGLLAELFGGVPIVTEVATEPRFDYVRATRAETYQFAIDELEAIVDDLPEITDQPGRVVKGVAQHYLSEFYLGIGVETSDASAYDQAIKYASDVIDGGTYSLMNARFGSKIDVADRDVYWDLFRIKNINYADGNTESIWTYQVEWDAFLAGDNQSRITDPRFWIPVYRVIEGVTGLLEDVGGRGVGYYAPTPLTETIIWEPVISAGDIRNAEHNIRRIIIYNDPTFPETFGQVVPQEEIDAANISLAGSVYPIFHKTTTDDFIGVDQGQNRSNIFRDQYAIRLPETILLRAEAYHRKGDNQLAADDINMIRNRAQCSVLASAGDVDIDYILDERARELYSEESRWNTLLRMGGTVAVDRIRTYAKHDWTTNSLTFDFNLLPIPQSAIDRNKDAIMEQNPGWTNR